MTAWSTFDLAQMDMKALGFVGGAFDGRYVYFVPCLDGYDDHVTRYDTEGEFGSSSSWSFFPTLSVNQAASGFSGAVFDGRYLYLVPHTNGGSTSDGLVVQYDTQQGSFGEGGVGWNTIDLTKFNSGAKGFFGAVFDGQFIYLVPQNNMYADGIVARLDTSQAFHAAWTFHDTADMDVNVRGFAGGAFDGRYVYFVPHNDGADDGLMVRYDTMGDFLSDSAWESFDIEKSVNAAAKGFVGAIFDGQWLYFVPGTGGVVARFRAKSAPSPLPMLPQFHGSFF
jgi:hypothetical protein